jgi:hypothetical protein
MNLGILQDQNKNINIINLKGPVSLIWGFFVVQTTNPSTFIQKSLRMAENAFTPNAK